MRSVRPIELNARFLEPAHIGEAVDLVTIDASFISLTMLLPRIPAVLKPGGQCLALVKPQFEVGTGARRQRRNCSRSAAATGSD